MSKIFDANFKFIRGHFLKIAKYTIWSAFIFLTGTLLGILSFTQSPETTENLLQNLFEGLGEDFFEMHGLSLVFFIFFNNVIKTFLAMLLGIFFALIPAFFIFINGYVLGLISPFFIQSHGLYPFWAGILPHGVIEIPAVILGAATGLFLGIQAYYSFFGSKEKKFSINLKREIQKSFIFFVLVVLPLLFLAALIEGLLTPIFLEMSK